MSTEPLIKLRFLLSAHLREAGHAPDLTVIPAVASWGVLRSVEVGVKVIEIYVH